ncbi:MAG TPA: lactonase family protein, partial [Puia sp.]|nr:lactonase family protein [Puia sp.]
MRLISLLAVLFLSSGVLAQDYYLFIGTYTNGKSKGIYVYDFNAADGSAKPISVQEASNPSYLAIAPGGRFVYAVNENDGQEGEVSAYSFSRADGSLHFIDKVKSGGESPCFISLDHARNWAFVANYNGGNLAAFPINRDGSIAPLAELIQHMGTGPNKERQEKAHVHSAFLTPDEHFIFSADLGMDKIAIYRFNPGAKKPLSDAADSLVSLEPGSGPRHLAFHPTLPFVYVIDELSATVDAFQYGPGKPQHLQRISSVQAGFKGQNGSADIHVSPDGRFVYA